MSYNQDHYNDYNNTTSDYDVYYGSSGTYYNAATQTIAGTRTVSGTETNSATNTISGTNTHTGTDNFNGTFKIGSSGVMKHSALAYSTATTGTAGTHGSLITVNSTKTTKKITLFGSTIGERITIFCKNASATGYFDVQVNSSAGGALTFDGTNDVYRFKKAGEAVEIIKVSTGRWVELARTSADGTAITSTST